MNDSFRPTVQVDQSEQYHVVLGHAPAFADGCDNADLMLAGHTHGGQIYIPGFGAIMTMSGIPRDWANGMTLMDDGRTLIVSRGVGCERGRAPRIRFCCRPELVVIDLVPEKG